MIMMMIHDEDRHGVLVKMMNGMMVREIMKMLTSIEGWCLEWLPPPPKGFNIKEEEREREREIEREPFFFLFFFLFLIVNGIYYV